MNRNKSFFVYILANRNNNVLYVGVTGNLTRRIWQHKTGFYEGFTEKYNVNKLVYYEVIEFANTAFKREKQLKKFRREKKINLIEKQNPAWKELSPPSENNFSER